MSADIISLGPLEKPGDARVGAGTVCCSRCIVLVRDTKGGGHWCRSLLKEDAVGRWENFRIRQYDPICSHWLILHKVDNNDQMRCVSLFIDVDIADASQFQLLSAHLAGVNLWHEAGFEHDNVCCFTCGMH